jgi:hypothetical protein
MSRLAAITVVAIVALGSATAVAQLFPNTRKNGRATVEYKNDGFTVVANYDYSQRNHDTPWLLVDIAAASKGRFVLHRDHIGMVLADGRVLKAASQAALLDDSAHITSLLQNARIFRRQLDTYFSQRGRIERLRFYAFPGGGVSDEAIVDNDRVTTGELFFKTPEGRWQEGTYRLVIDHERAKAALPITLQ